MKNRPPGNLPFNPATAILLDKIVLTVSVDVRTGAMELQTNRPDMNFLAVLDLFATQIQTICRKALAEQAKGNPAFVPPAPAGDGGNTPNGTAGEKSGLS